MSHTYSLLVKSNTPLAELKVPSIPCGDCEAARMTAPGTRSLVATAFAWLMGFVVFAKIRLHNHQY